jgi:hypothetical protein
MRRADARMALHRRLVAAFIFVLVIAVLSYCGHVASRLR